MLYYLYLFLSSIFTFVTGMLLVAFFILSERKILGYMQIRKGPNKVGLLGLFQSFADLIKLVMKFKVAFQGNRSWLSWLGVFLLVSTSMGYCILISSSYTGLSGEVSVVLFLLISGASGYSVLSIGWGSYNKYAIISAVRCCFSAVSFEAMLMCAVIQCSLILGSYNLADLISLSWLYSLLCPVLFILWLASLVGECGRTPFDYLEAESEMVSGINIEFSSVPFTCLFACEYFIMFCLSWLTSTMFFGGLLNMIVTPLTLFFFIWCRGNFPRARYDLYVKLVWEWGLLLSVFCFILVL